MRKSTMEGITEKKKETIKPEIIIRKENDMLVLEVIMPEKLRKKMEELASHTSGTILAI